MSRLPTVLPVVVLSLLTASTFAQAWEEISCVPVDPPPEMMFEAIQLVDEFEDDGLDWATLNNDQNARNVLSRDVDEKHAGDASLRVDYQFEGRPDYYEYIQLATELTIPEPGVGIGFWLRHDDTPFPIRLRVTDAGGETHQADMVVGDGHGWRFVAVPLDAVTNSWGGDGNKRLDYPCRLGGICIDRPSFDYAAEGALWIDDVAVVRQRELPDTLKVEAEGKRFGNIYDVGESVSLRMRGDGTTIRWRATNFDSEEIARGEGRAEGTEAAFDLSEPGYTSCLIEVLQDGELSEAQTFACAALPPVAGSSSDFVGIGCHFGQNHYPLECMELIARYGIVRFRDEMTWRSVETTKGEYVLPEFMEAYLRHAARVGLQPLLIFDYNNPHYDDDGFPNSPEAIAGFADYAVNLARLTEGVVREFEVWNEWIGGCGMSGRPGDHSPEAYGKMLDATYAAVKGAYPDLTVVGVGGEYGRDCAENVARMIDSAGADAMDGFSIHPYRYPHPPEESDLVGDVNKILTAATDRGAPGKAWITEIGYPTHRGPGGVDGPTQARLCIRTLALLQATEGVERVYWYDLKNDGLQREYNEHNFGLIHHHDYNCAPKPGMVAVSAFARLTGQARFVELTQTGDTHASTYERGDGSRVVVAWTSGPDEEVTVSGKVDSAFDLVGRPLEVGDTVVLSGSPIYLLGDGIGIGG